jgi:hypothetical protein
MVIADCGFNITTAACPAAAAAAAVVPTCRWEEGAFERSKLTLIHAAYAKHGANILLCCPVPCPAAAAAVNNICRWEEGAFERSKLAYINAGASVGKSLERATCSKILSALLGPDPRFR